MRRVDNRRGRYPEFPSDDEDREATTEERLGRAIGIAACVVVLVALVGLIVVMIIGLIKLGDM